MGLGISLPSLVAQIINFVILLALLYFVAYKPILRMLDQRSARIRESMETAEMLKEKAAKTEQQVQEQLAAARREGQEVISQARQIGERMKEEARQEARHEAQALVERAGGEIRRERDEAIDELRKEFVDLAIVAAEKVINETLDKEKHRRLIHEVLEQSATLKKG